MLCYRRVATVFYRDLSWGGTVISEINIQISSRSSFQFFYSSGFFSFPAYLLYSPPLKDESWLFPLSSLNFLCQAVGLKSGPGS